MCEIVGIHPELVRNRENQSGGAQYLMKRVDWVFWDKVEKDCEKLFKDITALNMQKKIADPTHHELQIWASDMWAVVWNAWMRGYDTNIIPELDFCWATDRIEKFDEKYIFHNAGIVDAIKNQYFYKADFRASYPYNHECETYLKDVASYKYFELMKKVGENSCLL
jgi:hypothetical protein